ncbi:MAG: type II toxin-antitoxin system VapB family antitoxin [Rhodoglobus sp.]|nr:type II toxin-antitoxin system VapB family antitoxin [Rhodoglobus sp.]
MGLNLKDEETVALVTEVAKKLGMTKTGAVRELARDKLAELGRTSEAHGAARRRDIDEWLERDVWPHAPVDAVTKAAVEEILGYDEMFRE